MKRILIHRHPRCPRCPRCERLARRHHLLDRIADTTEPPPGHRPPRKGEIIVQDLGTGEWLEGADAVEAIFRQVPLYWPLLPLLRIARFRARAERDARAPSHPASGARNRHPES